MSDGSDNDGSWFNPLLQKLLVIAAVMSVLLIPLYGVASLTAERAGMRTAAVARVANGVGRAQQVGALILVVPVTRSWQAGGELHVETRHLRVVADNVDITGSVATETRRSGIYQVPTFQASLHIMGTVSDAPLMPQFAAESGVTKTIGPAAVFLAISDPSGIRSLQGMRVDGRLLTVSASMENGLAGVTALLGPLAVGEPQRFAVDVDLHLSGTERLQFLPLADAFSVAMTSPWRNPSFSGAFAPAAPPTVNSQGFSARWQVLEINREFPQHWIDDTVTAVQLAASAFGVDFYQPVDTYQQNYRSNHYASFFILLTFMGIFLWEHAAGWPVHPLQYAMVGAALAVFYLLLLALSEHVPFLLAYATASCGLALLLGVYFAGVLRTARGGAVVGCLFGAGYSLLYWLVISEDYALLLGTLALFGVLAATMISTRRLDWYAASGKRVGRG